MLVCRGKLHLTHFVTTDKLLYLFVLLDKGGPLRVERGRSRLSNAMKTRLGMRYDGWSGGRMGERCSHFGLYWVAKMSADKYGQVLP